MYVRLCGGEKESNRDKGKNEKRRMYMCKTHPIPFIARSVALAGIHESDKPNWKGSEGKTERLYVAQREEDAHPVTHAHPHQHTFTDERIYILAATQPCVCVWICVSTYTPTRSGWPTETNALCGEKRVDNT